MLLNILYYDVLRINKKANTMLNYTYCFLDKLSVFQIMIEAQV
jgi:hypothetical protein